jgi:hypothetical protein
MELMVLLYMSGRTRTMLPWLCGLQEDLETLEVAEAGSWTELNEAHRDLRAASRTPPGLANNYGVIPDAFPAAVELTGLGALSDAAVCRVKHNKPSAISNEETVALWH